MNGIPLFQTIPRGMDISPELRWAVAAILRMWEAQRERQARAAAERARRRWLAEQERERHRRDMARLLLQLGLRAEREAAQAEAGLAKQVIRDFKTVRDRLAKTYARALADKVGNVLDPNQLPAVARAVALLDAGFDAAKWVYQRYGAEGIRHLMNSPEWASVKLIHQNALNAPQGSLNDEDYEELRRIIQAADPDAYIGRLLSPPKQEEPVLSAPPQDRQQDLPKRSKRDVTTSGSTFLQTLMAAPHMAPMLLPYLGVARLMTRERATQTARGRRRSGGGAIILPPEEQKRLEQERIEAEHMMTEPAQQSPFIMTAQDISSEFVSQPIQSLFMRRKRKHPFVEVTYQWAP